ncbi:MAG: galactose mutarotase [Synergistaceae bacterium]|jgi:aldose 1-epimerase|nr:galactose mutarotase [Synergistaceae bacterium]
MKLNIKPFGDNGASLYTFSNKNGVELSVTEIGASIISIVLPDRDGRMTDILLGYDSSEGYERNSSFYGATVGRCANRIGGASFIIDGAVYCLDKNEGDNVLHGGNDPYSRRMWVAEVFPSPCSPSPGDAQSVIFRLESLDGDQGMPGNAKISVTYSLSEDNKVVIHYHAVADKKTVFNLTNHSYFNLGGHDSGPIAEQFLILACAQFTAIDAEFIPTGEIMPVTGTPFDFTQAKRIGRDADSEHEQIRLGNGYDHNFVIENPSLEVPFAHAWSEATRIEMKVYTDLPGVQFYGGNNMGGDFGEKGGAKYLKRGGFCLETQYFPDSPNKPAFPSAAFDAGKAFDSTSIYEFFPGKRGASIR